MKDANFVLESTILAIPLGVEDCKDSFYPAFLE